jgi:hypothetical protein
VILVSGSTAAGLLLVVGKSYDLPQCPANVTQWPDECVIGFNFGTAMFYSVAILVAAGAVLAAALVAAVKLWRLHEHRVGPAAR